jgi:hypothetical protein
MEARHDSTETASPDSCYFEIEKSKKDKASNLLMKIQKNSLDLIGNTPKVF